MLLAGGVLVAPLLGGCDAGLSWSRTAGQPVQVVAGGGTVNAGSAADARVDGRLIDLAVDGRGTVKLLTETGDHLVLWNAPVGSALTHASVRGVQARDASQLAVGPAGEAYLAAGRSVWTVTADGAATRLVGSGESTSAAGKYGASPDGTATATATAFKITGVAVSPDGTLYYAEQLAEPQFLVLVRAVRGGRVRTVLGRDPGRRASEAEVDAAIARSSDPPVGTRATELVVGGILSHLAVGSGGTLYVSRGAHGMLALRPDWTAAAAVAGRTPRTVQSAARPFQRTGDAVNAEPQLFLGHSRVSLAADPVDGDLYLVTRVNGLGSADRRPPRRFVWSGSFSPTQTGLVAKQPASVAVWSVSKQGGLATAAPPDQQLAAALDELTQEQGRTRGWSSAASWKVRRALRLLLTMQDTPGAPILASDVEALRPLDLPVAPTVEVLRLAGFLDDDRTPTLIAWFARKTAELRVWLYVVRLGNATPPRFRPRPESTIRTHLTAALPALRTWAAAHQSLREVSRADVLAVLPAAGTARVNRLQGLRSIFRVLKARALVFTDPTARLRSGMPQTRIPLPVDLGPLRAAVHAEDPAPGGPGCAAGLPCLALGAAVRPAPDRPARRTAVP